MKHKFTAEEWDLLRLTPFLTYTFVAESLSGVKRLKLDDAEAVFRTWLGSPGAYSDGLHRELALDSPQGEWDALLAEARDPMKIEASVVEQAPPPEGDTMLAAISRLLRIRGILMSKLIVEQYEPFVHSVLRTSVEAPFKNVPRKAGERLNEAYSTVFHMLLSGSEHDAATVSVSQ